MPELLIPIFIFYLIYLYYTMKIQQPLPKSHCLNLKLNSPLQLLSQKVSLKRLA